jgi:hypothetical protein
MNWQDFREGWFRVLGLLRRRRQERELAEELEFHMAMKMRAGQSAEQAKRDFGGFEKWKEVCRDVARFRSLEDLTSDVALALRMLRKSPVYPHFGDWRKHGDFQPAEWADAQIRRDAQRQPAGHPANSAG